jgi:hypothetical protein
MKRILLASLLVSIAGFASYDYPYPPEELPIEDYSSGTDLEELEQPFVLELRKLEIEGHPHAFNPSIVRWNGEILLSFRTYLEDRSTYEIGLIRLDKELRPIGEPSFLQFPDCDPGCILKRQDPRLIESNGRLLVAYNNVLNNSDFDKKVEIRRMLVSEVEWDGDTFIANNPECLFTFEGMNPQKSEKNWVPFDFCGKLLFSQSLFPHRTLEPLFGTNSCHTLYSQYSPIEWNWGVLRGGTRQLKSMANTSLFFTHQSTSPQSTRRESQCFTTSWEPTLFPKSRLSPLSR